MYSESVGSRKSLGDVDVFFHEGIYHLFHLVLPNHDFVAHAVSDNCLVWRRVENAIHLGNPGSFDDSMLWTTHISKHPFREGWFRMFYTGLSRSDQGIKQRIGMAESKDLYRWRKAPVNWVDRQSELPYVLPGRPPQPPFDFDADSPFPLVAGEEHYESEPDEGRHLVSWRDPYYYREGDKGWLLTAGRVRTGPIVRRGCVAVTEEVSENCFESRPALHHPGLYDDVEVPNVLKECGEYYLLGSIREDAKVRYWHTKGIDEPWRSYSDNVLLPAGNYAGRLCQDDKGWLLFSFFTPSDSVDRTKHNFMPPPKRLIRTDDGHLEVRTFEGIQSPLAADANLDHVQPLKAGSDGICRFLADGKLDLTNESGFQIFAFEDDVDCFQWESNLEMRSDGKCGLVFRLDRETHDGYYLSLDLFKGVAQARAWGTGAAGSGEHMMQFRAIQSGYWQVTTPSRAKFRLIAYGSYIELTVSNRVVLSFADHQFTHGAVGYGVESGEAFATNLRLRRLLSPVQSDDHLANG